MQFAKRKKPFFSINNYFFIDPYKLLLLEIEVTIAGINKKSLHSPESKLLEASDLFFLRRKIISVAPEKFSCKDSKCK